MYSIDRRDRVLELSDVPRPDSGAPLPTLVSNEDRLLLAYIVADPAPDWDGSDAKVLSMTTEDLPIAFVSFKEPYAHMFGPPNDEAFAGHPLARRGLRPYAVFEVQNSSWIRRLERMNAVHPHHRAELFAHYRHFIFAFHDSMFECIADGYEISVRRSSIQTVLADMAKKAGISP